MDGDKRRASKRRSLAAGREILARYRASQGRMESTQTTDTSDVEEFFGHNDTIDTQTSSMREDSSFKDTTQSSISISEGETDIENMADRVSELKELLQGKEAVIESLSAEIDHMRADACSPQSSQSQNSTQYRDILISYQHKLQDFEQAVAQRDNLITELTSSLEKALASRDALKEQVQFINSLPILNQSNPENSNSTHILEETIKQLNSKLQMIDTEKNEEIKVYKTKINELNQRIDFLEKESIASVEQTKKIKDACEIQVEKIRKDMGRILDGFAIETMQINKKHEDELKNIKQSYEDQYKALQDRYSKELAEIETKHAKELSVFHSQLATYKKTIDSLKSQVASIAEPDMDEINALKNQLANVNQEKELLLEQIKLHKIQVEELTVKCVASTSVFESKESIERSLEEALTSLAQLRQENENLKFKNDDLSARYSAAQALIENNQAHERSMSSRIFELEKSLGRVSGINNTSLFSEWNETTYQTFDDIALQFQLSKQKLEEKEALEKQLIEKIRNLEENAVKASRELEEANLEKRSYEKQLKDMKNNCDKMLSGAQSIELDRVKMLEIEIKDLKAALTERETELIEKNKKLNEVVQKTNQLQNDCQQLMGGLQAAWAQCAEREQKVNESLAINDSKFGESLLGKDLVDGFHSTNDNLNCTTGEALATSLLGGIHSAFNRYEILFTEYEKLTDENQQLKHDMESLKLSYEDVNKEKEFLSDEMKSLKVKYEGDIDTIKQQHLIEIETLKKLFGENGSDRLREELEKKHAKEMEELRTYFEEKVLHVEKQYSEEVFSQSKKLSDDSSEVEDMTDDFYYGGGGDADKIRGTTDGKNNKRKELTADSQNREANCDNDFSKMTAVKHCQTDPEPVDSGELCELRAAYNLQLEEQISLARRDIVNALQEQIQALLAVEDDSEEHWPPELLDLRNKFSNSKKEIDKLKESHRREIEKLKEEYLKVIASYESDLRRISQVRLSSGLEKNISTSDELIKVKYESVFKMCIVLKGLVVDLIKYIVTCEDELNNTFITEIIKRRVAVEERDDSIGENNSKENQSEKEKLDKETPQKKIVKRVHFAPKSREFCNIINSDSDSLLDLVAEEEDIAGKLRKELEKCLARLRSDSAEIIRVSGVPGDSTIEALSQQILWTTKVNEELSAKLMEAEGIIEDYQIESKQLKIKVIDLQQKISLIESNKEIISEGYGEQDDTGNEVVVQDFAQLLEKARLAGVTTTSDPGYHLQLIEELCRCTEKILEDSRREKEDLQQQIDAADKQLKSTRKFLEEQASEREIERDEAAKHIKSLQEQLKERERDKERDLRISSESPSPTPESSLVTLKLQPDYKETVEALESQMREMTCQISDTEAKKSETESELKAAVEKIWILRDIIMDLEQQLQTKSDQEEILLSQIANLKDVISAQTQNQQELAEELDQLKSGGENPQLSAHISHLQTELQKHKLSNEHFNVNSTALKQMKSELREMLSHLDKRIKELEALHMCGSNLSLSQPSEDVSIRDQIEASRCETPDDDAPPILPLDQILKLKEKLMKHSRTEEVAFKKIKDLEMQLSTLKMQNEELQEERDILQASTSDYLLEIEKMKGRLEQYKQSAPFAQRQATSRLEFELHEVNSRVQTLEQKLNDKEFELDEMRDQLERANLLLEEKQQELESIVNEEDNLIRQLRERLELLEHEKRILESKMNQQERQHQELPVLIESMLADKNEEIDHLRDQLSKKEKQLEVLNSQCHEEPKQCEPKNSARTLSDILSIHSECEEMPEAIREASNVNFMQNVSSFRREDQELQRSEIIVPLLELGTSTNTTPVHKRQASMNIDSMISGLDLRSPLATENTKDSPQLSQKTIEVLEIKLKEIHEELKLRTENLNKREAELNDLRKNLEDLKVESKDSIENLTRDKDFYKNQYELTQESEKKIRRDLEEVENYLKIKSEEVDLYKEKIQLNEKILMELKNENVKLKREISNLIENNSSSEQKLLEKIDELNNLKQIIFEKDITIETLKTRNMEIEDENKQLYEFKTKFEVVRKDLVDNQNEIKRLTDGINNRDLVIQRLEEMARRSSASSPEDFKAQEIYHLKDLVKEKDKIIQQMTDDSKSLHRELETVHKKMKEPGNVVELRKKLQQEKKFNTELTKKVTKLSKELELFKEDSIKNPEVNELEDMVQRELNLSADLDKKIMDAIESESEEMSMRKIEMHSCNSLTIKPVEQDLEKIMEQYLSIRNKLKKQSKLNNELSHQKNELEIEREMLRSQIMEYENRILQLKADYENERKRNYSLNEDLSAKKSAIRNLEVQIKKEKTAHQSSQLEDSNMIEMLRIKLTSALNMEQQLRDNNMNLREKNKLLTSQLAALKFQIETQRVGALPSSPRAMSPPENVDVSPEKFEKSQRENQDLKSTIQTLESERNQYKKDLEISLEENEKLLSNLVMIEGDKEHLEIVEKRLMENLKMRDDEIEWLQRKIKVMTEAEDKRQQQRSDDEHELKSLRQEIKNVREVMNDWQIDTDQMSQQLRASLAERAQLTQVVVALRKTEEDLNKKLSEAKLEENRLNDIVNDLKQQLSVERSLSDKDTVDGQFAQSISELCGKLERYAHEKSILNEKLLKERQEKEKYISRIQELEVVNVQKNFDYNSELANKLQHLYGKYIRVDSKRKALAFQKRYLLCVIGGYQLSEENTLSVLAQLTNAERNYANYEHKRAKVRLRSVAFVVISMVRMKWLVVRWKNGVRRAAAKVLVEAPEKSFMGIQRGLEHSPPVREKRAHNGRGVNYDHFLERISNIQGTLGLAMAQPVQRE